MSIFDKRTAFKPFEYPKAVEFKDAINHSYWLVTEWNFQSDVHDFHTQLDDHERQIIRDTLLAISQVEVAVKLFWSKVGDWFPKPEIQQVTATFAESEVRHADAYSHLLHVLGLNEDFAGVLEVDCIASRVQLLRAMTEGTSEELGQVTALAFFSSFIENISLFAQFAIIKSFNKHRAVLKDTDNVVQATQQEETVHALFGQWLVGVVRKEHPGLVVGIDDYVQDYARRMLAVEKNIIQWIFRDGDLPFLPADTLTEFIASRINESVVGLGCRPVFDIDMEKMQPIQWFVEELRSATHTDFFHKKPVTYAKKTQPITAGDLF
jgi:ribonucleoside-diphosphate reductase beta chain